MNKKFFYAGCAMLGVEVLAVLIFLLTTLDYSWMKQYLTAQNFAWGLIIIANILAMVFILIGVISDED